MTSVDIMRMLESLVQVSSITTYLKFHYSNSDILRLNYMAGIIAGVICSVIDNINV